MAEVVIAEAAAEKVIFQVVAPEVAVADAVAEAVAEGPGVAAVVAAEVPGVAVLLGVNLEAAVADDRSCLLLQSLQKCYSRMVQVSCHLTNVSFLIL